MPAIFAHHDMLDSLDVLGLGPETTLEHVGAFTIYALLFYVAFAGTRWAVRRAWVRPAAPLDAPRALDA